MNQPPAFQFYVDNFIEGTIDMSPHECGCYVRLLCHQWSRGQIPLSDPQKLRRVAGGVVSNEVLSKFPDGKNERLERERVKQQVWREKSREGGIKGASSRALRVVQPPLQPISLPNGNSPVSSLQSPLNTIPAVAGERESFIKGWSENFEAKFKCKYQFESGRDGKAVKELLRMGILRIDLLEIAKAAWGIKSFVGNQAHTIYGFRNYFNKIQVEVKNGNSNIANSPQRVDRSIGTANEGKASNYRGIKSSSDLGSVAQT